MFDNYLVIEQSCFENHETGKVMMDDDKKIKGFFSSIDEAEAFIRNEYNPLTTVVRKNNQKYFTTGYGKTRKFYTIRNESSVYYPLI